MHSIGAIFDTAVSARDNVLSCLDTESDVYTEKDSMCSKMKVFKEGVMPLEDPKSPGCVSYCHSPSNQQIGCFTSSCILGSWYTFSWADFCSR
eukprot:2509546-Amphidinium_carterae.1